MLNYLKKFTVDIFPSVAATVIGAYIVNHYIVSRPSADAPAAAVSTADSKGKAKAATDANPEEYDGRQQSPGGRGQGQGHLREGRHGKERRRTTAGGGRKGAGKGWREG